MENLVKHAENIWTISDFWEKSVCAEIIAHINYVFGSQENMEPENNSQTLSENLKSRNNSRVVLKSRELAFTIWRQIRGCFSLITLPFDPIGINEEFRLYKYQEGQEFKTHTDAHCIRNMNERSFFSLLIYLNDEFNGGETQFDKIALKPKTGMVLFFPHDVEHSSKVLLSGKKYILRSDIISKCPNSFFE